MSDEEGGQTVKRPRETSVFFGHTEAERTLLASYRSGRVPHAWLLGGEPGIGKATLAYRFARFVLAHPDPGARAVQEARSLAVDSDHAVTRRIAAQAQGDLLVLERLINEQTGKLYTAIRVEDVRRTVSFFGSTPGEGGWRVAIVDSVDDLQREGANALLKVLEEPPPRALMLLISNAPGRELATIRSRCRRLLLRPLAIADVAQAAATASGREADDAELQIAATAAGGSVARALALIDGAALGLRQRVLDLIAQLPDPDPLALHKLGDALGGSDPQTLAAFMDLVNGWLASRLNDGRHANPQLMRVAETWERVNAAARDAESYNLERKPLVFAVFAALAQAAQKS
jgi:DNA polymerase-3 subunit delta'